MHLSYSNRFSHQPGHHFLFLQQGRTLISSESDIAFAKWGSERNYFLYHRQSFYILECLYM